MLSYRPPPSEEEFVSITYNTETIKIPRITLILASDFYAKNLEALGNEIIIEEIISKEVFDLFGKLLTTKSVSVPDEQWPELKNLLHRWECENVISFIEKEFLLRKKRQEEEARRLYEEQQRKLREQQIREEIERRKMLYNSIKIIAKFGESLFSVDAKRDMTVGALKKKIAEMKGIDSNSMIIVFNGKVLTNEKTLNNYRISNGSRVDVLMPMPRATARAPAPVIAQAAPAVPAKNDTIDERIRVKMEELRKMKDELAITRRNTKKYTTLQASIETKTKEIQELNKPNNQQNKAQAVPPPPPAIPPPQIRNTPVPQPPLIKQAAPQARVVAGQPFILYIKMTKPDKTVKVPLQTPATQIKILKQFVCSRMNVNPQNYRVYINDRLLDEERTVFDSGIIQNTILTFRAIQ